MGDTDFPAVMANWGDARDLASQWQSRSKGSSSYIESGTGIPTSGEHIAYESGDGSIEDPWFTLERKVL